MENHKKFLHVNAIDSMQVLYYPVFLVMFFCFLFFLQFKILNVPLSSHLAANHFSQQQVEQEERMRMKKLTLDINERQEQEDYQGEYSIALVFGEYPSHATGIKNRIFKGRLQKAHNYLAYDLQCLVKQHKVHLIWGTGCSGCAAKMH